MARILARGVQSGANHGTRIEWTSSRTPFRFRWGRSGCCTWGIPVAFVFQIKCSRNRLGAKIPDAQGGAAFNVPVDAKGNSVNVSCFWRSYEGDGRFLLKVRNLDDSAMVEEHGNRHGNEAEGNDDDYWSHGLKNVEGW